MEVLVRVAGRPCCSVWVEQGRAATARQLKAEIQVHTGIPTEFQRLLRCGAEAWDDTRPLLFAAAPAACLRRGAVVAPSGSAAAVASEASAGNMEALDLQLVGPPLPRDGLKGLPALHHAIATGDPWLCVWALLKGDLEEVNSSNAAGDTALHLAARGRCPEIGAALLLGGAFREVNAKNLEGYTALHLSAAYGRRELCAALLAHGDFREENIVNNPGEPKFRAVKRANAAIKAKVLDCPGGADVLLAAGFVEDTAADTLVLPGEAPSEPVRSALEALQAKMRELEDQVFRAQRDERIAKEKADEAKLNAMGGFARGRHKLSGGGGDTGGEPPAAA